MADATINLVIPKVALEAARALQDLGLGVLLSSMLPHSRTANDGRMRAILEGLTPEQRADVACLGANLVELVNEIGSGEPEHATEQPEPLRRDPFDAAHAAAARWALEAAARGLPGQCPACWSYGAPFLKCSNPWHAAREAPLSR